MTHDEAVELLKPLLRALARADEAEDWKSRANTRSREREEIERMFEIGKRYQFVMGAHENFSTSTYEVLEVTLPLVKVKGHGGQSIINTSSPEFQRANLVDSERVSGSEFDEF